MSATLTQPYPNESSGIAPNAMRLLIAGFMAIFAAGVGFAIRGGILANWGADFGFSAGQLGDIGGAGFTGFCFGIIIGGVVVDKIGYGKLVVVAFLLHVISALITFGAAKGQAQQVAFNFLYWGTFVFAVANGTLEAVANPLVSTLFPNNRTHYLNILHASWPAALVVGSLAGWFLGGKTFAGVEMTWKVQLGLFLIPTIIYGVLFFGQKFPRSAAAEKGLKFGEMVKEVGILGGLVVCVLLALFFGNVLTPLMGAEHAGMARIIGYVIGGLLLTGVAVVTEFSMGSVLLFVIFIAHALVGAVELGTDGWIQNITGNLLTPDLGKILFAITSLGMFLLRFCAHFIEQKLRFSPIMLLLVCAMIACLGLNLVSGITAFGGALGAVLVYALGKTFFWPTMLAVIGDRFPRTGAIAMSISGGIGMLSAGLIGSAGLGYAKDRFTSEELNKANPAVYAEYKAQKPSSFLFLEPVNGVDGAKLGGIQKKLDDKREELIKAKQDPEQANAVLSDSERQVHDAGITGDRRTLRADSLIPAAMAVIYLLLLIYFKTIGGYKPVHIAEEYTGGKPGPMQA